jgi:hypothetical protein
VRGAHEKVHCANRGAWITVFGIEKFALLPIKLDQLVGTAVQVGNRASGMTHDECRTDVAVMFDQEAHTAAAFSQLVAGTDSVARA